MLARLRVALLLVVLMTACAHREPPAEQATEQASAGAPTTMESASPSAQGSGESSEPSESPEPLSFGGPPSEPAGASPETPVPEESPSEGPSATPEPMPTAMPGGKTPAPVAIPLVVGLTRASTRFEPPQGDFDNLTTVDRADASAFHLTTSNLHKEEDNLTGSAGFTITRAQLEHLHAVYGGFSFGNEYADATIEPSNAVLEDLRRTGKSWFVLKYEDGGSLRLDLHRVEPVDIPITVIVNNEPAALPTIHIKRVPGAAVGDHEGVEDDEYLLDNPAYPISIAGWGPGYHWQATRITFPVQSSTNVVQKKLATAGRARIYGIYFDFGEATMRAESEPMLKQIADALGANPAWRLAVEGYTDNIGGDEYNMDLSRRRALAVKEALVSRHHIAADRLTTAGYGDTHPVASNDTLFGRALNRRVELVRQ